MSATRHQGAAAPRCALPGGSCSLTRAARASRYQYRYDPNTAATQKSESCEPWTRGGEHSVSERAELLLEKQPFGAHVSVRLLGIAVGVGIPEAPAPHAHALASLLAHDHLHDKLVARQIELRLDLVLDLVGNLARPLRRQLGVVPASKVYARRVGSEHARARERGDAWSHEAARTIYPPVSRTRLH